MRLLNVLIVFFAVIVFVSCGNTAKVGDVSTPEEALSALLEGNKRFVSGHTLNPNSDIGRVMETAPHQEPFAAVVGCSDSRVPVELIFDQGIGDIFVIRTAGNNVEGDMVMGSIEYAVDHLGVKVLLVVGHSSCGGVTSAITPGHHDGMIANLLHHIQNDIPEYVGKPELQAEAISAHTISQVQALLQNRVVADNVANGKLIVKGAHYDTNTGKVTVME